MDQTYGNSSQSALQGQEEEVDRMYGHRIITLAIGSSRPGGKPRSVGREQVQNGNGLFKGRWRT